jgi:esterase/lipase superfamily enzyme
MIEAVSDLIDEGKIQLFCTDSLDDEGWLPTTLISRIVQIEHRAFSTM